MVDQLKDANENVTFLYIYKFNYSNCLKDYKIQSQDKKSEHNPKIQLKTELIKLKN